MENDPHVDPFNPIHAAPPVDFVSPHDAQSIVRDAEATFTAFNEFQSGQVVTFDVPELDFLGERVLARLQVVRKPENHNAPVLKSTPPA